MKNGARYVVTTHWGTFSLDEASYLRTPLSEITSTGEIEQLFRLY